VKKKIGTNDRTWLPLKDLRPYKNNSRIGNVELIRASLRAHGQIKTLTVNAGTKTGRPNEILAGNHTFAAMKAERMETADVTMVDVDEDGAAAIVLSDNRSSDDSSYDEKAHAELLKSMDDISGSGYSAAEIQALVMDTEAEAKRTLIGIEEEEAEREEAERKPVKKRMRKKAAPVGPDITEASETLPGVDELKPRLSDTDSFRVGPWGIPALRLDMLVQADEVPDDLKAWAGSATREHDADQWWLYNWRIDSTSGMKDVSKVIVSFYAFDKYFENWYTEPAKYVTKLINSGIDMMLTPNYSMYTEQSNTLNLMALYKARYVGRYAQEAGIRIIPDVNWAPGNPEMLAIVLETLPRPCPVIALQVQTVGVAQGEDEAFVTQYYEDLSTIIGTIAPELVLLYGKPEGFEVFDQYFEDIDGVEIRKINSRLVALGEKHAQRKKKTTI
jgi:ParB-like chromosome segregation protein Spo0J